MTIARDFPTGVGLPADGRVPIEIKMERLAAQIASFERAGYRCETRAGLQAVVTRRRDRKPVRDVLLVVVTAGLFLVPLIAGSGRAWHRVVITVDDSGVVRYR